MVWFIFTVNVCRYMVQYNVTTVVRVLYLVAVIEQGLVVLAYRTTMYSIRYVYVSTVHMLQVCVVQTLSMRNCVTHRDWSNTHAGENRIL